MESLPRSRRLPSDVGARRGRAVEGRLLPVRHQPADRAPAVRLCPQRDRVAAERARGASSARTAVRRGAGQMRRLVALLGRFGSIASVSGRTKVTCPMSRLRTNRPRAGAAPSDAELQTAISFTASITPRHSRIEKAVGRHPSRSPPSGGQSRASSPEPAIRSCRRLSTRCHNCWRWRLGWR